MGGLINQKTALSSTNHWAEALKRFCITVGGVAAAVSVFVQLNQFSQILSRQCYLTPNDTNRRSQALQKAVQGCVAAPVDIEWHLLESVGVFWCLTASFSVLWCLEMWGGCLASFWKGIWVLVMDVFKVWVPPREHLSVEALYGATNASYWKCFKRQNSTHLTPLKHQNTKTFLYNLSKNHWIIALLGSV